MVIDSTGLYFRREGHGQTFIGGMSPPTSELEPSVDNMDVDYDYFDQQCWPILAHRVKAFENLKVIRIRRIIEFYEILYAPFLSTELCEGVCILEYFNFRSKARGLDIMITTLGIKTR